MEIDYDKEAAAEVHKTGEQSEKNFMVPSEIIVQFPGDDDVVDLKDEELDKDESLNLPKTISSTLILERINILIVKSSENIKNKVYPGIHPVYNLAAPDLRNRTRGAVLLAILNLSRYLVRNNIYWTYRELLYYVRGYLTKQAKNIPWIEIRANVRLLEKILQLQSHSLPFYGRPRGFIAVGKNVELKCGSFLFGRPGFLIPIPLGDNSVRDLDKFTSNADSITFCESHAEVNRLVERKILETEVGSNMILATSSGNPDKGFRMMLSKIASDLKLPVKCITDCDLGGFFTLFTLAFGTFGNFRKDPPWLLTPEIEPIGILPQDILESDKYFVPLSQYELDSLSTLKAKWTSHGVVLDEDHPFEQIIKGFLQIKKKMSIAQMHLNGDEDFPFSAILKAVGHQK